MADSYRKSAAPEIDHEALEKLSKLADQVGVSIEDLTLLLEKRPELVRNQVDRIKEEVRLALACLKMTI